MSDLDLIPFLPDLHCVVREAPCQPTVVREWKREKVYFFVQRMKEKPGLKV